MAAQRRPLDVTGFSSPRSTRLCRARTLSGRGASPAGAGAVHSPKCEQRQLVIIDSLLHPARAIAQRCTRYSQPVSPHIPVLAPTYPRGLSLCLDVSRIVGIAANASGCAWARIRQGCLGRLEPGRGSGHPSWPRNRINAGQAYKGGSSSSCFVGFTPPKAKDRARPVCIRDAGCLVIVPSCLVMQSSNFIVCLSPLLNGYLCAAFIFFLCLLPSRRLPPTWPPMYVCNNSDARFRRIKGSLHSTSKPPCMLLWHHTLNH